MWVSGRAASRPGTGGIAACVPTLMNTRSPASTRVPPSLRCTLSVYEVSVSHDQLGAGRLVIVQMRLDFALDHVALTLDDGRHVGGDRAGYHAEASTLARP